MRADLLDAQLTSTTTRLQTVERERDELEGITIYGAIGTSFVVGLTLLPILRALRRAIHRATA